MRALKRLLELLGIAEKDDALRGLRCGEDIGQRHLARFIHEQDVDRSGELVARPQPRRSGRELRFARLQRFKDSLVFRRFHD